MQLSATEPATVQTATLSTFKSDNHSDITMPVSLNNNEKNNVNLQESKTKFNKHKVLLIVVVIVIILAALAIPLGIHFSQNSEGSQSHSSGYHKTPQFKRRTGNLKENTKQIGVLV